MCIDFHCKSVATEWCVREVTNLFNNSIWATSLSFSSTSCSFCRLLESLSKRALTSWASCMPTKIRSQSKILNNVTKKIRAILTSYLFPQLCITFLNSSFEPLSSQFLCSGGFLQRFFVLCCLLSQRGDGAFQIINLHLLLSQGSLHSLEKTTVP